jgi:hypothetical protein
MPCPDCGQRIELALQTLLTGLPIWCVGCGVKLDIDLGASAPALDRLRQGMVTLETIRERAVGPRRTHGH